ncbi:MAG: glycosyltransferase [Phaeodactylibacter sp.]|uniref:glycosyltransferase n=1 Tax=Phaeodactylibacter sp. TaxID=1940289 RepID=UPI0032EF9A64
MWLTFIHIIVWLSALGLVHTYLLYPLLMRWVARGKTPNTTVFEPGATWPQVAVIMSAYNEAAVIEEKMAHLLALNYPEGRLSIFIGSDCSDDGTNALIAPFAAQQGHIYFFPFRERRGKPEVINELASHARTHFVEDGTDPVFVVTDASVMPTPDALLKMVQHFRNPGIGLVDAHIRHTGMQAQGISQAEDTYISGEVRLKYHEGLAWGRMMGPFGGCYAIRARYFSKVPPTYLVDDFYITMRMFEQGGLAINELGAICYEAVSHEISEEYRRKARISAGNFQNLTTFPHLWWPPFGQLRFAFFSHKALRWLGPFFLLLILAGSGALAFSGNLFWQGLFAVLTSGIILVPVLDQLLRQVGLHWLPLRGAHYFLAMNLALLTGFFKFIKGVRSNVWQPTKRN